MRYLFSSIEHKNAWNLENFNPENIFFSRTERHLPSDNFFLHSELENRDFLGVLASFVSFKSFILAPSCSIFLKMERI